MLEVKISQNISFIPMDGISWYYTINMVAGEGFEPSTIGLWAQESLITSLSYRILCNQIYPFLLVI